MESVCFLLRGSKARGESSVVDITTDGRRHMGHSSKVEIISNAAKLPYLSRDQAKELFVQMNKMQSQMTWIPLPLTSPKHPT